MEEHHAADHRDHGGQAGEGRGAGGADDGDGAVGQQKGQRGAADAQIQLGPLDHRLPADIEERHGSAGPI